MSIEWISIRLAGPAGGIVTIRCTPPYPYAHKQWGVTQGKTDEVRRLDTVT